MVTTPTATASSALPASEQSADEVPVGTIPRVPNPLPGSLPASPSVSDDGKVAWSPAIVFTPTHLISPNFVGVAEAATSTPPGERDTAQFADKASALLQDGDPGASRFAAAASDATYDFDEYILLHTPGTVYYADLNQNLVDPWDPLYTSLYSHVTDELRTFILRAVQDIYKDELHQGMAEALRDSLMTRWTQICAVRVTNRLARYDRRSSSFPIPDLDAYYASQLRDWLGTTKTPHDYRNCLRSYFASKTSSTNQPDPVKVTDLLATDCWEASRHPPFWIPWTTSNRHFRVSIRSQPPTTTPSRRCRTTKSCSGCRSFIGRPGISWGTRAGTS